MRTLNRPMFNMGGPIKQGIMQGIREPYRGGGAALVGNPVYPQTGGREHHNIVVKEAIKRAGPIFGKVGNIFKGTPTGQVPGWAPLSRLEKIKSWFGSAPAGKYLAGSPEGRLLTGGAGWAGAAGQKIGSVLKGAAKSPLTVGGVGYGVYRGIKGLGGDDAADVVTGVMKPGGFPKADKKKIKKAQAAFAEAQRDTRVKKYLDMMGYDRSKKTAVADALIDASKIVSDRGTLETKNITRDLINPIIQATSKRFDKPEQIREAVGLMSVKAAIQKDLEDPQVAKLRGLQITDAEEKLAASASFEGGLEEFLTSRKGKVGKAELIQMARLLANKHGDSFTVIEDVTAIPEGGNGIYVSGSDIYRVIDGNAQQLA